MIFLMEWTEENEKNHQKYLSQLKEDMAKLNPMSES